MRLNSSTVRSASINSTWSAPWATTQALVLEKNRHVGEPVHPFTQHLLQRRLIDELLGRVPVTPGYRQQLRERHPVGVDEVRPAAGLHVGGEPVGQPDLLPDAHHLLVGGDGPGPRMMSGSRSTTTTFRAIWPSRLAAVTPTGP
jgi:hypothetical protein